MMLMVVVTALMIANGDNASDNTAIAMLATITITLKVVMTSDGEGDRDLTHLNRSSISPSTKSYTMCDKM